MAMMDCLLRRFLPGLIAVATFSIGASFSPMLPLAGPLHYKSTAEQARCNRPMSSTLAKVSLRPYPLAAMPASEQERLLLTEPAQTAFINAEMRSFLSAALERNDGPSGHRSRWEMTPKDLAAANLIDADGTVTNREYLEAKRALAGEGGDRAVDLLCDATSLTFRDGFSNQPGLLSALGSAICYFRDAFRTPANLAACERVGVSDYDVAHHITDMYHHRNFRGAYTKTLLPSGSGEIAARIAVGLAVDESDRDNLSKDEVIMSALGDGNMDDEDEDECILWSPTTSGVCIHWKSDDEAWRKKRFERIQMEGTKDPRRGGSGTTR